MLQTMARQGLSEQEIRELLQDDASDCGSWCSDDSIRDPNWDRSDSSDDELIVPNESGANVYNSNDNAGISLCTDRNNNEQEERIIVISETNAPRNTSSMVLNQAQGYKRIIWKKMSLAIPPQQTKFRGNTVLPGEILDLETPYEFLRKFISDELLELIVEESIRYSVQKDPNRPLELTVAELRKYLGICYVMSYIHLPSTRDYWSAVYGPSLIKETMSSKRFEKIRQFLHFNDNNLQVPKNDPQHDRLHKVRPFIKHLQTKFAQVPFEESLSVDEQICATKAKSFIKQYLPSKPHKWGYKIYVLCGISGFAYDFELYTGQENAADKRLANEPDLGASSNIVVQLSRKIQKNVSHKLYFDNYFTSLKLMVHLAKNGIYALGTVRRNRIPNGKMPTEKQMKNRGDSIEMVTTVEEVDVSCVAWLDNKQVMLMSTLAGINPVSEISRFDRKKMQTVQISCPNVVKVYNRHMGGVDLLDSHLGRHRNKMRSKKWYMRIFYHLLDVTMVNSWILFKMVRDEKDHMRLADFRASVAESFCKAEQLVTPIRGRPSEKLETQLAKKRRGPSSHMPVKDVRTDRVDHWAEWGEVRQRCRLPNCSALTFVMCSKCGIHLCFNKGKNCFRRFHGV